MMENKPEILRQGVRIFRPDEYARFVAAVPKLQQKIKVQVMLLTGMRYVELERFHENPKWFDGNFINLPKEACKKVMRARGTKERTVRLNMAGRIVVPSFLAGEPLPCWQVMGRNMRRWAVMAGLSPKGVGCKTMRKTWESWLGFCYRDLVAEIAESQGHDTITAIKHYRNLSFMPEDGMRMQEYVQGWWNDGQNQSRFDARGPM